MLNMILAGTVIGIGGTIMMDLWAVALWKLFGQARPDMAMLGRWFWHLGRGKVFHDDIADAEPHAREQALGWAFHYAVGIVYGIVLALVAGPAWLQEPTFLPAWILGIVTVGAGWFLLQPGLGIGWAASRTPNPNAVRALNLVAHTFFALGMYAAAVVIA